ncbi:MAG: primosomal protein N', partial [Kiritimatiellaeota bacterium]|nr:primosomal protein N' [Kiritimatiellota bacterium]
MILRAAIDTAVDRLFDYGVPPALESLIQPGVRVSAPFGTRVVSGYVVEVVTEPAGGAVNLFGEQTGAEKLRLIHRVEDPRPFFSTTVLSLLRWIAAYYCAPLEMVLRAALPAPVRDKDMKDKERFYVSVAIERHRTPLNATEQLTPRQTEILERIRQLNGGWLAHLCAELKCSPPTLRKLADSGHLIIEKAAQRRDPFANRTILPTSPLPLMPEQAVALDAICHELAEPVPKPMLLFGVTGSGKTEVYLQAIARVLENNGGALVLVPEIALTPQAVQRFASRFGKKVAILHSALGDGERFDEWHRIRDGRARVVVGTRSAIFAPVQNLRLIIVDEEHDPSYKQEDAPRHNARDVAVMRASLEKCAVVLGTATPGLETWHNARRGKYRLLTLARRVTDRALPAIEVVDMRLETAAAGHAQIFSRPLLEAVHTCLERREQAILFLNRRGHSTTLLCPACGHTSECAHCSVRHTYHQDGQCLRCHSCGAWLPLPKKCPACGADILEYSGVGTQRVEAAARRCFPRANILRMDADVTARQRSHDELFTLFRSGRADILIGTQMVAKGHDFPNVTLVGVLAADTTLNQPDFRAAERTFQLLAQVAGRAGRGDAPGRVILQTYTPRHPAVTFAQAHDYPGFAEQELASRGRMFPPFMRLVCLTFKGLNDEKVAFFAASCHKRLTVAAGSAFMCSEPFPAALAKS